VAQLLAEDEAESSAPAAPTFVSPQSDKVDLSEAMAMDFDSLIGEEKQNELEKCRICYKDFALDSSAKDLFDQANSVLLFHIEVISGVWVGHYFITFNNQAHIILLLIFYRSAPNQTNLSSCALLVY